MQIEESASKTSKEYLAERRDQKVSRRDIVRRRRRIGLSRKELEVLGLLADGYKIKQISYQLSPQETLFAERYTMCGKGHPVGTVGFQCRR
jgi:DNA-binding NarL/FixJ family response regulator